MLADSDCDAGGGGFGGVISEVKRSAFEWGFAGVGKVLRWVPVPAGMVLVMGDRGLGADVGVGRWPRVCQGLDM